jgi:uncharacterized protein (DUF1697 family)
MAVLREIFEGLGCTDVVTVLNSGNVIFSAKGEVAPDVLAKRVEEETAVATRFVILDAGRLRRIADAVPFEGDESKLMISFMSSVPTGIPLPDAGQLHPELFTLGADAAYQWLPNGVSNTKLKPSFWRQFPPETTARNLRTVKKLLALLERT